MSFYLVSVLDEPGTSLRIASLHCTALHCAETALHCTTFYVIHIDNIGVCTARKLCSELKNTIAPLAYIYSKDKLFSLPPRGSWRETDYMSVLAALVSGRLPPPGISSWPANTRPPSPTPQSLLLPFSSSPSLLSPPPLSLYPSSPELL